jgi:hypothetical protein
LAWATTVPSALRVALDTELAPALTDVGFEIQGKGGYSIQWNSGLDLARNIRESKWNKFGAERFVVLFSIWMIETESRRVRWIWKSTQGAGGDWADPRLSTKGKINSNDGGRGVYFQDPDGHLLEIITRPYGSG